MTETKLSALFDFQRFEKNSRLQKLIDSAHRRIEARELSDDELDSVAAAGAPESIKKPKKAIKPGEHPV